MYPIVNIVTFRARLCGQCKARDTLYKEHNAAMAAQARSLRAGRKGAIRGVMPLGKGDAIAGESCLAANPFPAR